MHSADWIGSNIRFCRKSLRLSQESLANALDLNRGNIASYEKGSVKPSIKKLQSITSYFGFGLEDFIDKDLSSLLTAKDIIDLRQKNEAQSGQVKASFQLQGKANANGELLNRYQRMRKIFEGLRSLHEFRQPEHEKLPREMQGLVFDYNQVLHLFEELLDIMANTLKQGGYYLRNGSRNEFQNN